MNLVECIEAIKQHEKELVLFNLQTKASIIEDLRAYFEIQNVRITTATTASGRPADIAVLSNKETVLTLVDVALLQKLLDHTQTDDIGIADTRYEPVLEHLKETTFTSYDTKQMLYASREIEDRTRRVGRGTIHAGFQHLSILTEQQSVYTDLAERGLEVHAYGIPDITPPDIGPGHVHGIGTEEIATMWFVVFDGGGKRSQKSALLAEERQENTFYGAWTYDSAIVDSICQYLEQKYISKQRLLD